MRSSKTLMVVTLLFGFLGAAPAFGALVIDFGTGNGGEGGLYTLLAGGNASGANIPVGTVNISGAPNGSNGQFDTSGACSSNDANGSACLTFNTTTNTITIVGDISALGVPNTTLLTGSFSTFVANGDGISGARGPDTKSPLLLEALGATGYAFSYFGFSITTNTIATVGGTSTVISTDIRNTGNPVPEPSAIVLFGTALLGCCALYRRRNRSRQES